MWAKILVGVVAAVTVAGTGVYLAVSDDGCHKKCGGSAALSQSPGCCSAEDATACPADESACCVAKAPACCSESASPTDAVAACAGSAALISTKKAPTDEGCGECAKGGKCCQEK